MDMKKARTIIEAAVDMPWSDWCMIVEMVSRKYNTARNAATIGWKDADAALLALKNEQPRG